MDFSSKRMTLLAGIGDPEDRHDIVQEQVQQLNEAIEARQLNEAEEEVRKAIRQISFGRSIIMIAHRLATVIDTDCIYVLQGGRIVESGNHSELLSRGGHYSSLYRYELENTREGGEGLKPPK